MLPTTLDSLRRDIAKRFAAAGLDSAMLDARALIGAALDLDLTALAVQAQRPLMGEEIAAIEGMALRRLGGEPVARIVGVKEFWGLPLHLSSATLVPRPDTETVVEAALALSARDEALRIADIGTGSGAILLALLHERPRAAGIGTDLSGEAIATARDNAVRLGLAARASFVACDFGSGLAPAFDLVVSNPPYIPTRDIPTLDVEVRAHDPHLALDGGQDGLVAYRALADEAKRLLKPGGWLVVELGIGQAGDVAAILRRAGLTLAGSPQADLAGIPRVWAARKLPP